MTAVDTARIGLYEVLAPLSRSARGEVLLVADGQGRRLVLKRHQGAEAEEEGLCELQLLGVVHSGLACPLDAGREPHDGTLFTVTERVQGRPLGPDAFSGRPPDEPTRLLLAARLLAALAVVHDRGLLHRDLKDDNVLLEEGTGRPVLLDFGLAVPLERVSERPLAGTPRALAPELFGGGAASVASDLWAAGLVLAEAFLGRRLFGAEGAGAMADERRRFAGLPEAEAARVGPVALRTLIERLLDPDPARRPADARSALAALVLPDDAEHDALLSEDLSGARSAALAAADPRCAALIAAVAGKRVWLELFPGPDTSLSTALGRLSALAGTVADPTPLLRARRQHLGSAERPRPGDLAALAEGLASLRPLTLAVWPADARDEQGAGLRREVAAALASLPRVAVADRPPPAPATSAAVLAAWIGDHPRLCGRLASAPPRSWSELHDALAELQRCGAVTRTAAGLSVQEARLPAAWPAAGEQSLPALPAGEGEVLAVLALSPRALDRASLARVCGRPVAGELVALQRRGWVSAARSDGGALHAVADGRLRRLAARLPLPDERRAALAEVLAGGEAAPDETAAAALLDVLADAPEAVAAGLAALLRRAADVLRHAGRLDLAAALLERALAAPHDDLARGVALDLIDVLTRAGRHADAAARVADARARHGEHPALLARQARLLHLTGRAAEGLPLLADLDLSPLSGEEAAFCLQERADLLRAAGRLAEAAADLREALRRQGGAPHRRTLSLLDRLGSVALGLGQHDAAVRHFEAAAAMARDLGLHALVWGPTFRIGRAIRDKGEQRRGLAIQEEAAALCEAAGEKASLVDVLNSLGAGWLRLGDVDTARRHLARALRLARETGAASLPMVLNNIGRALAAEGRHAEAEESFAESLSLRSARGDERGRAAVALTRGAVRLLRGRLDDVRADLQLARGALAGVQAPDWELEAELLEAGLALAGDDRPRAQDAARRAVALAGRRGGARVALAAEELLARAGGGDPLALQVEGPEPGPWTAGALATRAAARAAAGQRAAAHDDLSRALAILGETPDGPTEARVLLERLALDLPVLHEELQRAGPDVSLLGQLTARVGADAERAAGLVELHELLPLRPRLSQLLARKDALAAGDAMTGLAPLAERLRDLERLVEINKQLNTERDTQKLLDLIVDSALELTGAARGFLILFDGRAEEFRAARHIDESTIRDPQFQVSHSVARKVARSGQPLLTANAIDDPRLAQAASISKLKLLSILCVPLVSRDNVLGAVYLDHPQVVGRFKESHLATVSALAEQAAIALQNAQLSEGLARSNQQLSASREEIERLNEALQQRLVQREAELEEARESLEASRRALGLRYDYSNIVTRSPRMHEVLDLMDRVTDTDFPVVITGESGTGKELIARAVHYNGRRARQEFLSLNCAAFAEPLIEAELFGSVKGAFTGADRDRKGLFTQAHLGTLFLDEVGDMSLSVQKRLLRVLQEGEFLPVGGREVVKVDVRILCATHRDLSKMVEEGAFREDLYYRLAVGRIHLPPLRERPEDIALLLPHFLRRHGGKVVSIEPEALSLLEAQNWPGNVRELENFAMNLLLFERDSTHLSGELVRRVLGRRAAVEGGSVAGDGAVEGAPGSLKDRRDAFERRLLAEALRRAGGNKAAAARELGVGVRSLYKMLERLGLPTSDKP